MNQLSDIAEAIRNYKLNAEGGYEEWEKVPCSEDYRMYVPSMGFDVTGADEVKEVIFGWLTDIEAKQELIIIIEENKIIKTKTSLIRLIIVKIKERPLAVSDKTE